MSRDGRINPPDVAVTKRRMCRSEYAHVELSELEVGRLLTIWAQSHQPPLIDFEPERVHWYIDQENKMYAHFYGQNQIEGAKVIFE